MVDTAIATAEAAVAFIRNVLDSSTEYSIVATDPDGVIVLWNEGARRLYGYEADEIIGRSWTLLHTGEDAQAGLPKAMADRAIAEGNWTGEITRVRKDGTRFFARVVETPCWGPDGKLSGFLLISCDVTEQARVIRELERAQVCSRSLIDSERKRFEQAERLEATSRAKDRFLASMSHELRTPLNAIVGFTETLLMGLPGPLNSEQTKQLRTVQVNSKHLLSMINDLLDLARIESGKFELHPEAIECGALINEVLVGLRPLAAEKQIGLEAVAPPAPIEVHADRRALTQILTNLIDSAIEFTEQGGVRLELSRLEGGPNCVTRFNVTETGCGIRASDQEKLFAAFEQIGRSSGRPYERVTLGLYISQTLARAMGAAISFDSEVGQGSMFTLELHE